MIFTLFGSPVQQCKETFVSLRIRSPGLQPDQITRELKIKPAFRKGRAKGALGIWSYSTQRKLKSRDVGVHINKILGLIRNKEALFKKYHRLGYEADLFVYWASLQGHGGPLLTSEQMKSMARFHLDIRFDVYF